MINHDLIAKIKKLFLRKIVKDISYLTISGLLVQLISFVINAIIARELLPSGYGYYNLFLIQAGLFGIISAFGYRMVLISLVARKKYEINQINLVGLLLRLLTTLLAILGVFVYSFIAPERIAYFIVILIVPYLFISGIWETIEAISFGERKMGISSIVNIIQVLVQLLFIIFLPNHLMSVKNLIVIFMITHLLKTSFYLVLGARWNYFKFQWKANHRVIFNISKDLLLNSIPFFILALFTYFSNQLPVLILESQSNITEVGYFNAGSKLLNPLNLFISSALAALFPNLSAVYVSDIKRFGEIVKSGLNLLFGGCVFIAFVFSVFRNEIVLLVYGAEYLKSAEVISFQVWYFVLYAVFSLIGTVLSSSDRQKSLSILSIFYSLIALPIYYYFSSFGAVGLSLSFILAGIINMTYHWAYFLKVLDGIIKYTTTALYLIIFVIMVTLGYSLPNYLSLILRIVFISAVSLVIISTIYKKLRLKLVP